MKTMSLKTIALSILLGLLGFLGYDGFMEFSISLLTEENLIITSSVVGWRFKARVAFAVLLATIPALYIIGKRMFIVQKNLNIPQSTGIIVLSGIMGWFMRIGYLKYQLHQFPVLDNVSNSIDTGSLKITTFLFVGMLIGVAIGIGLDVVRDKQA